MFPVKVLSTAVYDTLRPQREIDVSVKLDV